MMSRMGNRGPLEQSVLELLWGSSAAMSVAEVLDGLDTGRDLAYTTVMTVLDRLAKKHMVTRERVERAWRYLPADPQHVVVARDMTEALRHVPDGVRLEALQVLWSSLSEDERAALRANNTGA